MVSSEFRQFMICTLVTSNLKWGHQHKDQLDRIAKHADIKLTGKLCSCAGCGLVKARSKATVKTTQIKATKRGERIFIDATGPLPKTRGGMKYWFAAVDDYTDKTWVYFAKKKSEMVNFVGDLVVEFKGLKNQSQIHQV